MKPLSYMGITGAALGMVGNACNSNLLAVMWAFVALILFVALGFRK